MSDPFAELIPTARSFLTELAQTNTRDWFHANKSRYDSDLKHPATLFVEQMAHELGQTHGWALNPKLFRPQRDVRFSKDKTPYHTHLHMLWSLGGTQGPSVFFGISPDYVTVGGGIMGFDKPTLTAWREWVARDGDRVKQIVTASGFDPNAPELKRIPAPYPKDHTHGDLLRHKSFTVWKNVDGAAWAAPSRCVSDAAIALSPLLTELSAIC